MNMMTNLKFTVNDRTRCGPPRRRTFRFRWPQFCTRTCTTRSPSPPGICRRIGGHAQARGVDAESAVLEVSAAPRLDPGNPAVHLQLRPNTQWGLSHLADWPTG